MGAVGRWSNGVVEGFVNKVKWIKRSSYGQAGFALLQRRVLLHPAAGDASCAEQSKHASRKSASAHQPGVGSTSPTESDLCRNTKRLMRVRHEYSQETLMRSS